VPQVVAIAGALTEALFSVPNTGVGEKLEISVVALAHKSLDGPSDTDTPKFHPAPEGAALFEYTLT